jgi:hypothetical protein
MDDVSADIAFVRPGMRCIYAPSPSFAFGCLLPAMGVRAVPETQRLMRSARGYGCG